MSEQNTLIDKIFTTVKWRDQFKDDLFNLKTRWLDIIYKERAKYFPSLSQEVINNQINVCEPLFISIE